MKNYYFFLLKYDEQADREQFHANKVVCQIFSIFRLTLVYGNETLSHDNSFKMEMKMEIEIELFFNIAHKIGHFKFLLLKYAICLAFFQCIYRIYSWIFCKIQKFLPHFFIIE